MKGIAPLQQEFLVKAPQAKCFRVFTEGMTRWWPPQHHIGTSPLKEMHVEPRLGGRWYSVAQDGSECDLGKVLLWDAPKRLILSWQITAEWKYDPDFITEVELSFEEQGPDSTLVRFEHRDLERYGDAAPGIREQIGAPSGWPSIIGQFAAEAAR